MSHWCCLLAVLNLRLNVLGNSRSDVLDMRLIVLSNSRCSAGHETVGGA